MEIILTGTKKPQSNGSNNPDINSFACRDFQVLLSFCLFAWKIKETFYLFFFSFNRQQKKNDTVRLPGGQAGCCQFHFPSDELNFSGRLQEQVWFRKEIILHQKILRVEKGPADPFRESGNTLNFRGICCKAAFAISDQALCAGKSGN